jgi:protein-tyrosine sulfotransferase
VSRATRAIRLSKIPLLFILIYNRLKSLVNMFHNKHPLYRKGCLSNQPVLILASGRSGNTLLRSMLTAGDELAIPPESYVLPKVIRLYKSYNFLSWELLCSLIIGEFEAYKEFYTWNTSLANSHQKARDLPKKKRTLANIIEIIYLEYANQNGFTSGRWGDKTPINSLYADKIAKVFPEAYYIHLIRDPRAVAVSYRESGLFSDIESGANFWVAANDRIEALTSKNKVYRVHYESLVIDIDLTLEGICHFLKLNFSKVMLSPWKNHKKLGDVVEHAHHKNISKPISTEYCDSWKKVIDLKDQVRVEEIVSSRLKKYNYD